jgi:hypothetical protein
MWVLMFQPDKRLVLRSNEFFYRLFYFFGFNFFNLAGYSFRNRLSGGFFPGMWFFN